MLSTCFKSHAHAFLCLVLVVVAVLPIYLEGRFHLREWNNEYFQSFNWIIFETQLYIFVPIFNRLLSPRFAKTSNRKTTINQLVILAPSWLRSIS